MAVYEHLYGAYEGESHSSWSRFLGGCKKFCVIQDL